MKSVERVFRALAEPRRMEVLRILNERGELSVGEITENVNVTQQAISLHLKVLEAAGVVVARKAGTRHLYAVRLEGFEPANEFLASFWDSKLIKLKKLAEQK